MLRGKFFKRKKGKKESALSFWRKNDMQYFFEKNIGVAFLTTIFFSKNPPGLDIVRAFFRRYNFTFFFFIFSYPGLSEVVFRVLLIIKCREFKARVYYIP